MADIINILEATSRLISHTTKNDERARLNKLRTRINVMTSMAVLRAAEAEEFQLMQTEREWEDAIEADWLAEYDTPAEME